MFSVYYHWITKYQWITILCILLFFLFVSINKKECFSVGFESDISISSNLFLDSSMCCDDKDTCSGSDNCRNSSCFYDPNKIKIDGANLVYNCSGNCKYGKQNTGQLCISDTKSAIENIFYQNVNNFDFIKNFNSDNILCSQGNTCNRLPLMKNEWEKVYNTIDSNDNVKKICTDYQKLKDGNDNNIKQQNCSTDLIIGKCEKN